MLMVKTLITQLVDTSKCSLNETFPFYTLTIRSVISVSLAGFGRRFITASMRLMSQNQKSELLQNQKFGQSENWHLLETVVDEV